MERTAFYTQFRLSTSVVHSVKGRDRKHTDLVPARRRAASSDRREACPSQVEHSIRGPQAEAEQVRDHMWRHLGAHLAGTGRE